MRYYATLNGEKRLVDIEPLEGSRYRIRIDEGEAMEVDAERVEGQVVNLLVDRRSWDADLEEDGEKLRVLVGDEHFSLELMDERKLRLAAARTKSAVVGPVLIESPMPGKVVKLLVAVGDEVQEGQGIVVVEAMKMENELRSPKAGVVKALHVSEGATVEGRQPLAAIE